MSDASLPHLLTGRKQRMGFMTEDKSKILQFLEEWKRKDGGEPKLLEKCGRLLTIQLEARDLVAAPVAPAPKELKDKVLAGVPILSFEDIPFDWGHVEDVFTQVVPLTALDGCKSLRYLCGDIARLQQIARAWYAGDNLSSIAESNALVTDSLASAVAFSLWPYLSIASEALLPLLDQESWRRGYCPVCGGMPDMAFLQEDEGARYLLCARCDAQWLFQRLECPYCGNTNQEQLSYFTDDSQKYRLYLCDKCKAYLKAVDVRRCEENLPLTVHRIMTLDLDRQGTEAGYRAGHLAAK